MLPMQIIAMGGEEGGGQVGAWALAEHTYVPNEGEASLSFSICTTYPAVAE